MDTIYNKVMKEIPSDKLNVRNDIVYEINSQTPFTGNEVQYYDTGEILFKAATKTVSKKVNRSHIILVVNGISKLIIKKGNLMDLMKVTTRMVS